MSKSEPEQKPHYAGHRGRLRARLTAGGDDALADYEVLEMLLWAAQPRADTKPLAKALLAKFGDLAGVFAAEPAALATVKGLGEAGAAQLRLVRIAAARMLKAQVKARTVLSSWDSLVDYCRLSMELAKTEQFRILFLDRKNGLIADEVQEAGTVDHTPVYPREVIKRALELGATALILVHNHPSGDPTPSKADIAVTKDIVAAGQKLNVTVHDHLVIGRGRHLSFKTAGLL
ncbi:MAG: JAB domain-containing protein [Alphaproteobacteria bacterium]|nr:JAB domain-containing protein [Alphaproteobacteria bacterium]